MQLMKKTGIKDSHIDGFNEQLWIERFGNSNRIESEAESILNLAEKNKYKKGIAYSKLNLAAAYFYQSKNDLALTHLTDAIQWFNQNTHEKGYARSLLLKGNIYESFGDYEKTLSLWLEALRISKEINDIESEGEACSQLGLIYTRLCNTEKALEYFHKGLRIREAMGDENAVASSLNRIGMVLRQTKKYDESLDDTIKGYKDLENYLIDEKCHLANLQLATRRIYLLKGEKKWLNVKSVGRIYRNLR